MWKVLRNTLIYGVESTYTVFKDTKRFAGHSKWANIKHTKAEKDGERAVLFAKLSRQMRVAIAEEGSWKPSDNTRLAQIIEQAKKKSMPLATINGVLEKASKSTTTTQTSTMDVRGPGGCIIVVELITDNMRGTKALLNNVFKKNGSVPVDHSARHVFHHKGFIVTEFLGNLDSATENAIAVGAEDVEEIESEGVKCLQFTCEGKDVAKVANQLGNRDYKIISMEATYVPHVFANLSDSDIERAQILYSKLEAFNEVIRIHDNIA